MKKLDDALLYVNNFVVCCLQNPSKHSKRKNGILFLRLFQPAAALTMHCICLAVSTQQRCHLACLILASQMAARYAVTFLRFIMLEWKDKLSFELLLKFRVK